MTVGELIAELQEYNSDLMVYKQYVERSGCCGSTWDDYTEDELEEVYPGRVDVRELAPGPRGGPVKMRTVARPVVVIR